VVSGGALPVGAVASVNGLSVVPEPPTHPVSVIVDVFPALGAVVGVEGDGAWALSTAIANAMPSEASNDFFMIPPLYEWPGAITRPSEWSLVVGHWSLVVGPQSLVSAEAQILNPMSVMAANDEIPLRPFGRHPDLVSALALGGYHIGKVKSVREAIRIVHAAIDGGITFLDNAWEYHDGESEERVGRAIADRRDRVFLMTKVCTHGRDARTALRQLEQSLRRLRTDYLDLWQVHECVYANDPDRHFAAGGVIEALDRAKADGKVRYVGFTGHKDPAIHLRMLAERYPFDSCQLPLNGFDAHFRSFEQRVLPELAKQRIAAIGMKSLGGDGRAVKKRAVPVADALRYAMSLPVVSTVSGIDSMRVLRQNLNIARGFAPMTKREMQLYRQRTRAMADDGRFELYKTTAEHEGEEGRAAHGFPSVNDVPR
jgi:aryl-alcohol dehydrogenase-like predicted oxidoreductase